MSSTHAPPCTLRIPRNRYPVCVAASVALHGIVLGGFATVRDEGERPPEIALETGTTSVEVVWLEPPPEHPWEPPEPPPEPPEPREPRELPAEPQQPAETTEPLDLPSPPLEPSPQRPAETSESPEPPELPAPPVEPEAQQPAETSVPPPDPAAAELPVSSPASVESQGALVEPVPFERNEPPRYPRSARRRGWSGRVEIAVDIDADGHVERVRITESSGHGTLDDAALRAVRGWRYSAATRDGVTVAVEGFLQPVEFVLDAE